ncbi:peptidoglycan DD-metalloendopeptidase family protein [Acinetobacter pollinis]|uniref:peptidoglycan DD-metalloendopeptidase family protein n=1 Tax=Acinetobacter pollinis TaxID=2605270 RepID=UPI0018C2C67E|nr:peptidoglycan DD-metalloendopeptidase family protein [Acinetobacter pollinis]MBF7693313.1 peptidoglycan DD-metalloendopeptidase family protein [Acinetobacter pollinis]MBF7701514.1 peptidoglycan DD-metalloendopeptidase family protein [Acinetobacter pollinis]
MSEFYTVKKGDTLWGIAKHYNIHVSDLASINHLRGNAVHHLRLGQKIYLKEHPKDLKTYETKLTIKLFDLAFKPIKKATLRVEYDGKKETIFVHDGVSNELFIEDHAKGLKVYFKNLKEEFDLVADHKKVSIGNKVLKITSRKVLVEGSYHPKEGVQHTSTDSIKRNLRKAGKEILEHTRQVQDKMPKPQVPTVPVHTEAQPATSKTAIPESPKTTTPTIKPKSPAQPMLGAPKVKTPPPVNEQKRTDHGNSTHVVAVHFSEDNFIIIPENEKYRGYIFAAAKRHNLTPHSLAALINAEAAKLNDRGEWNPKSKAPPPGTAAGLTQFLDGTWLGMAADPNSLVGQYVATKYPNVKPKDLSAFLKKNSHIKQQVLDLRFNPEMSIDAAGAYARANLKGLQKYVPSVGQLQDAEALAKLAYLLHHEGLAETKTIIKDNLTETRAYELLNTQLVYTNKKTKELVTKRRDILLKRYHNDPIKAYKSWLMGYVNDNIRIQIFYPKGKNNQTTYISLDFEEVLVQLNPQYQRVGEAAPLQKAKTTAQAQSHTQPTELPKQTIQLQAQSTQPTGAVGGENGWFDPIRFCKLRTEGLSSIKGSTFGMVRDGGKKAHQGIDLEAEPGTDIFAVCGGSILISRDSGGAYGKVIVLEVNVADLPPKHQAYAKKLVGNQKTIYFFYAHLSKLDVGFKDTVQAGQKLGQTGCTGNASNMKHIATGAHLHFEVRHKKDVTKGLGGRLDPLPFISSKLL